MYDLNTEINDVVENFFMDEEAFTAFNVTLELQKRGHAVKHTDVRQRIVSEIESQLTSNYDADDYIKTNVCVNGTRFNLYHDDCYDIDDFQASVNPNPITYNRSKNSSATRKSKGDTYDQRGRFTVPGVIVDEIVAIGEEIKVTVDVTNKQVTLSEVHVPIACPSAVTYNMTRHENIFRVASKYIKNAFGYLPPNLRTTLAMDPLTGTKISITVG